MTQLVVNPFQSEAQRRWMHANEPEMAKRWEAHTPKGKRLPVRKRRRLTANVGRIQRLDPSRTLTLRRQWDREVAQRFDRLRREILDLVVGEDALGLRDQRLVMHGESYFKSCPRDDEGHCKPGSGSEDHFAGLKRSGITKPVKLKGADAKVVQYYQDNSYDINGWMREGVGKAPEAIQRQVILLRKVFEKNAVTLKQDLVVYRGLDSDEMPAGVHQDPAFVSTTTNPESAAFFGDTVMKIVVPAGTKVLPLLQGKESEVILPQWRTFTPTEENLPAIVRGERSAKQLSFTANTRWKFHPTTINADEPGRWITVKGSHIFIPEGKDADDAIKEHFEGLKKTGSNKVPDHERQFISDIFDDLGTVDQIEKLGVPVREGVKSRNPSGGFGNCTALALKEYKKSGGDLYVGYAIDRDRYDEAVRRHTPEDWSFSTEAIPHAWNVQDGVIVDRALGSEDAKTMVYLGRRVPDAKLQSMTDDKELARKKTLFNRADNTRWKFHPTTINADEPGRWITVKGNHIFIPEGKDAGEAIKEHFEGVKKEKKAEQPKQPQVKQIDTPEFKAWFKDSKVVDEKGEPMVVYHGSENPSDDFGQMRRHVYYFTSDTGLASSYGTHIKPCYLSIKNPAPAHRMFLLKASQEAVRDELIEQGYDGMVSASGKMMVAFYPSQIKSATGNRGTFDPDDPIITHTRWKFHSAEGKVQAFLSWLKIRLAAILVGDHHDEESWWHRYIVEGWRKGAGRAFDDARPKVKAWQAAPEAQETLPWYGDQTREQFLRDSFNWPVSREKVKLLASRTFTDLKGVTDATAARIAHTLVDGLTRGANPREVGRALAKEVDVGKARAQTIARTEIIRTHAEGQLAAFDQMGVTHVGVAAEWATAGDARVCPKCRPLNGVVMRVEEATGLLPRHPGCRCCWLPSNVGEDDQSKQKRTKSAIQKAIDDSYRAGLAKGRTLEEQKKIDPWGATDKTIDQDRPKSIFNEDVINKRRSFFADCERDEAGHCMPEGVGGERAVKARGGRASRMAAEQRTQRLMLAQKTARAKARAAPVPTEAEVAEANARIDRLGADVYESQIRGNSIDRKQSRLNLLTEFGDGHHCHCVYCGLTLDETTVTRDKIRTAREGGRYKQGNLVPACLGCNQSRGDTPWEKIKWAKR